MLLFNSAVAKRHEISGSRTNRKHLFFFNWEKLVFFILIYLSLVFSELEILFSRLQGVNILEVDGLFHFVLSF